jgi:hypothetical protein
MNTELEVFFWIEEVIQKSEWPKRPIRSSIPLLVTDTPKL